MKSGFIVEVNYGDNNFNIDELKRVNHLVDVISKHPFPGDLHGLSSTLMSYEYVNESAIEQLGNGDLNLKYRKLNIKKPQKNLIIYVLEDWIGSNTSNPADREKILWGRREYTISKNQKPF